MDALEAYLAESEMTRRITTLPMLELAFCESHERVRVPRLPVAGV